MDSDSNSDIELKLTIEDVLFFNQSQSDEPFEEKQKKKYYGKKRYKNAKKHVPQVKISDEVMENMIIDDLKGKHFSGYVKYFKSNYKDCLDKSMKNSEKSIEARIKANKLFETTPHNAQFHKDIWELYSKSIAFAPVGSKELVLGYECRSNLLLHLKKYEDCVKDIDRALALTEFDLLKVKLLCRKMTCFVAMNRNIDEKQNLWINLKHYLEKIDGIFKNQKFLKMIERARIESCIPPNQTQNKKVDLNKTTAVTSNLNHIKMVYNKEIRIVANRDFTPGQVIFMSKPLFNSFNPNHFYAYCSHCLSLMWAGIPCDECSLCMYCTEKCKSEAWKNYHRLECKILPHINIEHFEYNTMHLSTRILLKGINEFGSFSKLKEKMQEIDKLRDECKLDRSILDSNFGSFYASLHPDINSSAYNLDMVTQKAMRACFLTACLIQTCDILEKKTSKLPKRKELSKDEDIVSCAFILLKIMITCERNIKAATGHHTTDGICDKYADDIECSTNRHCLRGTYYDIYNAMFEKSCNPNVAKCWTDTGYVVYYCVQPIKKMEKITVSSNGEFYLSNRDTRDKYGYYSIYCQCTACLKDWPTMNELFEKTKQRRSKVESREAKIVQKYLERNQSNTNCVEAKNCKFSAEEYEQLLQDVNDVVKVFGQPSFASSLMIDYLCLAFEEKYGPISLIWYIPKDCRTT